MKKPKTFSIGNLTTTPVAQFTVPTATIYVIKHIHVSNTSALPVAFTVTGIGASVAFFSNKFVNPNDTYDWYSPGVAVTATADVLASASSGTTNLNMIIAGDEITLG